MSTPWSSDQLEGGTATDTGWMGMTSPPEEALQVPEICESLVRPRPPAKGLTRWLRRVLKPHSPARRG